MNKKRAQELEKVLKEYSTHYHTHDMPLVSDEIYDSLFTELSELYKKEKNLKPQKSIIDRVGNTVSYSMQKFKHTFKQWSFDNVFSYEELSDWDKRNHRIVENMN